MTLEEVRRFRLRVTLGANVESSLHVPSVRDVDADASDGAVDDGRQSLSPVKPSTLNAVMQSRVCNDSPFADLPLGEGDFIDLWSTFVVPKRKSFSRDSNWVVSSWRRLNV